jgi:hypothetical protein
MDADFYLGKTKDFEQEETERTEGSGHPPSPSFRRRSEAMAGQAGVTGAKELGSEPTYVGCYE